MSRVILPGGFCLVCLPLAMLLGGETSAQRQVPESLKDRTRFVVEAALEGDLASLERVTVDGTEQMIARWALKVASRTVARRGPTSSIRVKNPRHPSSTTAVTRAKLTVADDLRLKIYWVQQDGVMLVDGLATLKSLE